jgi:hypothetical protein
MAYQEKSAGKKGTVIRQWDWLLYLNWLLAGQTT